MSFLESPSTSSLPLRRKGAPQRGGGGESAAYHPSESNGCIDSAAFSATDDTAPSPPRFPPLALWAVNRSAHQPSAIAASAKGSAALSQRCGTQQHQQKGLGRYGRQFQVGSILLPLVTCCILLFGFFFSVFGYANFMGYLSSTSASQPYTMSYTFGWIQVLLLPFITFGGPFLFIPPLQVLLAAPSYASSAMPAKDSSSSLTDDELASAFGSSSPDTTTCPSPVAGQGGRRAVVAAASVGLGGRLCGWLFGSGDARRRALGGVTCSPPPMLPVPISALSAAVSAQASGDARYPTGTATAAQRRGADVSVPTSCIRDRSSSAVAAASGDPLALRGPEPSSGEVTPACAAIRKASGRSTPRCQSISVSASATGPSSGTFGEQQGALGPMASPRDATLFGIAPPIAAAVRPSAASHPLYSPGPASFGMALPQHNSGNGGGGGGPPISFTGVSLNAHMSGSVSSQTRRPSTGTAPPLSFGSPMPTALSSLSSHLRPQYQQQQQSLIIGRCYASRGRRLIPPLACILLAVAFSFGPAYYYRAASIVYPRDWVPLSASTPANRALAEGLRARRQRALEELEGVEAVSMDGITNSLAVIEKGMVVGGGSSDTIIRRINGVGSGAVDGRALWRLRRRARLAGANLQWGPDSYCWALDVATGRAERREGIITLTNINKNKRAEAARSPMSLLLRGPAEGRELLASLADRVARIDNRSATVHMQGGVSKADGGAAPPHVSSDASASLSLDEFSSYVLPANARFCLSDRSPMGFHRKGGISSGVGGTAFNSDYVYGKDEAYTPIVIADPQAARHAYTRLFVRFAGPIVASGDGHLHLLFCLFDVIVAVWLLCIYSRFGGAGPQYHHAAEGGAGSWGPPPLAAPRSFSDTPTPVHWV